MPFYHKSQTAIYLWFKLAQPKPISIHSQNNFAMLSYLFCDFPPKPKQAR